MKKITIDIFSFYSWRNIRTLLFLLAFCGTSVSISWAKDIVVSTKPLYGLVAKISRGSNHKLYLLYDGVSSPHTTTLRPSEVELLRKASLIFWIGPVYESQMVKYIVRTMPAIALSEARGILKLPNRTFEEHSHSHDEEHDHEDHAHHDDHVHSAYETDGHLWLHPHNAEAILRTIAKELTHLDPEHAVLYRQNLIRALVEIKLLFLTLKRSIKPKHYISFHDFSQYFDKTFETTCVDVITSDPHIAASPHHIEELEDRVAKGTIDFLITEPQFKGALLEKLAAQKIPIQTIDYMGATAVLNDKAYETILRTMARAFA